jgi:hypothetical protein
VPSGNRVRERFREIQALEGASTGPLPPLSPPSPGDDRNELGILDEVPTPHPPRLLPEPVQPLEPCTRHPGRGSSHPSDHEVEASSDAHRHGRPNRLAVAIDEPLLLGSPQRDEYQVRLRRGEPSERLLRLLQRRLRGHLRAGTRASDAHRRTGPAGARDPSRRPSREAGSPAAERPRGSGRRRPGRGWRANTPGGTRRQSRPSRRDPRWA